MAGEALPIDVTCRVLGVTDSGFYAWRKRGPSQRSLKHVWVTEIISQIHDQSHQTYGARRVHAELTIGRNIAISHGTVEMLMQRANLKGLPGPRKRHVVHQTPTSSDLVDRNFKQTAPNRLWVTDITEHAKAKSIVPSFWTHSVDAWLVGRSTRHSPRHSSRTH